MHIPIKKRRSDHLKLDHETYLKRTLESLAMQRESLHINHRIAIAEYNAKDEMIKKQIDSIERQLEGK